MNELTDPKDRGPAAAATTRSMPTGYHELPRDRLIMSIGGLMVTLLLSALDQTIVATAMPTIGRELGDLEHLPWVVTSYLLASTAVTPLYGKFSDMHGRRVTLLIGITIFIAGSIACALAPTLLTLILARGVQGSGEAG